MAGLREGRYRLLYVVARAAGRRGQRRLPAAARRRAASASSPSTRRTASASGATTSGPSTGSSARLRERLAGRQPARLHRDRDRARAPRHRRAARPARSPSSWSDRSIGRTWSIACCRAPTLKTQTAGRARRAIAARPASSTARRAREVDALAAWLRRDGRARACRITPASPTTSGTATRTRSSTSTPTSSWRPSRSAWASIDRTCASSSTPARRSRSSTTSRSPAAPAATGSRPSAC